MGAPLLSANAFSSLTLGIGYSSLAIPSSLYQTYCLHFNELTYSYFNDNKGNMKYDKKFLDSILNYEVITFGMGLGISKDVYKSLVYLLNNYHGKLLIDADGLNSLAKYGIDVLEKHKCEVIITPHFAEFSRLCKINISSLNDNLIKVITNFVKKYNLTLILKSNSTLVVDKNDIYLFHEARPNLAKAGTGDLLSGILSGCLTKAANSILACKSACKILENLSLLVDKDFNENTITASFLIEKISQILDSNK